MHCKRLAESKCGGKEPTYVLLTSSLARALFSLVAGSQATRREVSREVGVALAGLAFAGAGAAKDDATTKAVGRAVLLAVLGSRVVLSGDKGSSSDGEEGRGLHCEVWEVMFAL